MCLFGEMSLVGPRPEMPTSRRITLRCNETICRVPGITGLWQISPARAFPIHQHIEYDLYYIARQSLPCSISLFSVGLQLRLSAGLAQRKGQDVSRMNLVRRSQAMQKRVLVTGAGGFIGHHLVQHLSELGYWVRGADLKCPEFCSTAASEFRIADLRNPEHCKEVTANVDMVFALAADMGGMGYISNHHATILHSNTLINFNTLEAARLNGVKRYLYTSSACVYPEYRQLQTDTPALCEEDAYPAAPQDAYGWEKLITERLCTHYGEDYGMDMRIVRFHNIFGPHGTWEGGREKAPRRALQENSTRKTDRQSDHRHLGRRRTDAFLLLHQRLRHRPVQDHDVGLR